MTKQEATDMLRELLPPGTRVGTILRHCSRSGMSRSISVMAMSPTEGVPIDVSYQVGLTAGFRVDQKHYGLKVGGCGMDMGFHLVYALSYSLYPAGFGCIGEGCPSNDHHNGDRDYTPHGNGFDFSRREVLIGADHWHADGGYSLRHYWL